ncbi:MAG TPA: TonB-dependent receptor [Planctomycetota bacterium]|nr:TonB-dependent receptor [Planctomycetota bacterium]
MTAGKWPATSGLLLALCLGPSHVSAGEDKPAAPAEAPKASDKKEDEKKQTQPLVQPTVVVTATRLPTPQRKTGVNVDVVGGEEDRVVKQNIQLSESLRETAGITIARSGLPGDATSVFTRGGNSNHTLFLFDGFKVNRQGGNFNLSGIDPVNLNRIEIARGPASSLFGTDAVTGVINVITEKGQGDPHVTASAAGGTYGTDRETLAVEGHHKKFSYSIASSRLHRNEATFNNSELEVYNYAGRFDFQFNKDHSIKAVIRGNDQHKGFYDDSATGYGPTVEPADPNDQIKTRDLLTGLEYKGHLLPIWDTTLRLGHYLIDYRIISDAPNPESPLGGFSQSTGRTFNQERRPSLDWQNDIKAYESEDEKIRYIVSVGTSVERESFNQDDTQFFTNVKVDRTNWSVFLQNRLELFDRAFITAGVRREENGQFGDFLTARGDVSILIPESCSRLHGSVGNAFRAPSFYETFSAFGNRDLQPEENFAYDVGIEQTFWNKRISVDATWFHNQFDDLVDFGFDTNTFANLKTAETRGFEFTLAMKPIKKISIKATATLMHTEDDQGRHLLRRPGSTYTASVIAHPIEGLDLSVDLIRTGSRADLGPTDDNPYARVRNPGYTRVDAAASYRFCKYFRAFGRVENVFNKSYEEVRTFPSPGSNILAGLEFSWQF